MLPVICGGYLLFVCIGLGLPRLRIGECPSAFFMFIGLVQGTSKNIMAMEKTQRKQSLNSLSNTPKLFDLNELLSSLKITPGQMENMKGLIYIEGLTEKQVRQKLSHSKIIRTNRFGVNSCLYYIFFEDVKGRYLCLFNSDKECFRALFFSKVLLNQACYYLSLTRHFLGVLAYNPKGAGTAVPVCSPCNLQDINLKSFLNH